MNLGEVNLYILDNLSLVNALEFRKWINVELLKLLY